MAERKKLTNNEISTYLAQLVGWRIVEGKLHKEFQFENFIEAFAFMTRTARLSSLLRNLPILSF